MAIRVYNQGGGLYGVAVSDMKASCCDCIIDDTFEVHAFRVFYVSYVAACFSCGQPGWPWVRLGWVGAADVTEEKAAFDPAMDEEIALTFVWRWGRQAAKFSVVGGGGEACFCEDASEHTAKCVVCSEVFPLAVAAQEVVSVDVLCADVGATGASSEA